MTSESGVRAAESTVMTAASGSREADTTFGRPYTSPIPQMQPSDALTPLPNAVAPLLDVQGSLSNALAPVSGALIPVADV